MNVNIVKVLYTKVGYSHYLDQTASFLKNNAGILKNRVYICNRERSGNGRE